MISAWFLHTHTHTHTHTILLVSTLRFPAPCPFRAVLDASAVQDSPSQPSGGRIVWVGERRGADYMGGTA
jgi:hypothetical protein